MPKPTQIIQWRTRRQRRRQRSSFAALRWLALAIVLLSAGACSLGTAGVLGASAVAAILTRDLPDFATLVQNETTTVATETTKIYAQAEETAVGQPDPILIYEIIDPLDGEPRWLSLDQIPQPLIDATVAGTDPDFGSSRSLLTEAQTLFTTDALANDTITQQVIRQNLLPPPPGITNTLSLYDLRYRAELLLTARRAERQYTKEQILEWYLNTAYYGQLAIGIEAAARVYFDKSADNLTLAEITMLATLPQAPADNPIDHFTASKARQKAVLTAMAEQEMITPETAATTELLPVTVSSPLVNRFDVIAPDYALAVQQALIWRFGPERVLRGGLRVITGLDLSLQQQAECVARAQVNRLSGRLGPALPADELARCPALDYLAPPTGDNAGADHNVGNAAIVMLDPRSGTIKALVGGLNNREESDNGSLNLATAAERQPGSLLQPLIYLTALSQGYTPATMVLDVETDFGDTLPFVPTNVDGDYHGPMNLRDALGGGYNIPAIQVASWVGINKVIGAAHNLGITGLRRGDYDLSLPLDGGDVTLLDIAYAFAVIDNAGVMVGRETEAERPSGFRTLDPVLILQVTDGAGNVLYEYGRPQRREILTPQLAYLMNDMLSDRSARCAAYGCPNVLELPQNRPAAVQPGTTADFRDAWTVGYTPQLVTAVWLGNSDNEPMNGVTGITGAAPVWQALMAWAHEGQPIETWERPSDIIELPVCDVSGLLPTPHCPTIPELFIQGTEPTLPDTMYQQIAVNRETERLATIYTPAELVENRTYLIYPEAAAAWAQKNGIAQPPTEYDTITLSAAEEEGEAAILSPQEFATVRGQVTITGTARSDNFDFYRLAYFQGLQPTDLQSIAENVTTPREAKTLAVWDTEGLNGLYTLLLTVVREDGSFTEVTRQITVDNTPPQVEIVSPQPNAEIPLDAAWVGVQAQAVDDVAVDRVAFYLDDTAEPLAIARRTPFTARWRVEEPGCHRLRAVAVDRAGNEAASTAVSVCLVQEE